MRPIRKFPFYESNQHVRIPMESNIDASKGLCLTFLFCVEFSLRYQQITKFITSQYSALRLSSSLLDRYTVDSKFYRMTYVSLLEWQMNSWQCVLQAYYESMLGRTTAVVDEEADTRTSHRVSTVLIHERCADSKCPTWQAIRTTTSRQYQLSYGYKNDDETNSPL